MTFKFNIYVRKNEVLFYFFINERMKFYHLCSIIYIYIYSGKAETVHRYYPVSKYFIPLTKTEMASGIVLITLVVIVHYVNNNLISICTSDVGENTSQRRRL